MKEILLELRKQQKIDRISKQARIQKEKTRTQRDRDKIRDKEQYNKILKHEQKKKRAAEKRKRKKMEEQRQRVLMNKRRMSILAKDKISKLNGKVGIRPGRNLNTASSMMHVGTKKKRKKGVHGQLSKSGDHHGIRKEVSSSSVTSKAKSPRSPP